MRRIIPMPFETLVETVFICEFHFSWSSTITPNVFVSLTLDEKSNLPQICLVQICCKYEIRKALQPVQTWRWPNSHKSEQIRPSPHLHWVQSSSLQRICTRQILCKFVFSSCVTFFILLSPSLICVSSSLRVGVI